MDIKYFSWSQVEFGLEPAFRIYRHITLDCFSKPQFSFKSSLHRGFRNNRDVAYETLTKVLVHCRNTSSENRTTIVLPLVSSFLGGRINMK